MTILAVFLCGLIAPVVLFSIAVVLSRAVIRAKKGTQDPMPNKPIALHSLAVSHHAERLSYWLVELAKALEDQPDLHAEICNIMVLHLQNLRLLGELVNHCEERFPLAQEDEP